MGVTLVTCSNDYLASMALTKQEVALRGEEIKDILVEAMSYDLQFTFQETKFKASHCTWAEAGC